MKLPDVELRFTEEKLEKAFVELLGTENYPHFNGDSILRKMQVLVDRYNQRDESDVLRSEFYEETLSKKAFYDILKELCVKYDFKYPEDKLIELAKAVKELVEGQSKYPDWNKHDDIKSALKVGLILLLDEFGYPPVERDEVYVEIFAQAENFKKIKVNH